jgi:hypothetical protein
MEDKVTVGSKWKRDRDNGDLTDLRVFWQTIVQPDPATAGKILVEKHGALWGKVGGVDSPVPGNERGWVWRRYGVKPFDLVQEGYVEYDGIQFENNALRFSGDGYIKINDPGLSIFAEIWEIDEELSGLSSAVKRKPNSSYSPDDQLMLLGINFQIEADVLVTEEQESRPIFVRYSKLGDSLRNYLADLNNLPVTQPGYTPPEEFSEVLAHVDFAQLAASPTLRTITEGASEAASALLDAMSFNEVRFSLSNSKNDLKNNQASLKLDIANQRPDDGYRTESYELLDTDFHRLTVLQDGDRKKLDKKHHYFEFYVDALQLSELSRPNPGATIAQHYFSTGESVIYIGYDPLTELGFRGAIKRVMFDPNASCPECP